MFDLNGHAAPVPAETHRTDTSIVITFINGEERIEVDEISIDDDSILIRMPLYDSELRGVVGEDGASIHGNWHNLSRGPDHKVPFTAVADAAEPAGTAGGSEMVEGEWAVTFDPGDPDSSSAIGIFRSHGEGRITGTFATETGDHRFLAGVVQGDSLRLSSFDGSHVYLYKARIDGDSMSGRHFSGTHWTEDFIAVKDPDARLRDPATLTTLATDTSQVTFDLPDLEGQRVSSSDPRFRDKVLVVNVMGSWCSNCTDASIELDRLYREHKEEGLEVVALAFEKHEDPDRAKRTLKRYRGSLDLEYPILYAGRAGKEALAQQLPFLDRVRSYPTMIFIDHKGEVRSIHSGFYGPGTGDLYTEYLKELNELVERLLLERSRATATRR